MGQLGLNLITGPANAGKVALLLRRYLEALDDEPYLIVPNRSDVERVERDLLDLQPALLGGSIGTFDDLFKRIAYRGGDVRQVATDAQRTLLVRRALASHSLNGLGRSARFGGFADALLTTVAELESGLLDPNDLDGELAALYAAYRGELDRLDLWDTDLLRRHAAERIASELDAWSGEPVFAYGFEDLTGAEWSLLQALAGRTDVTVSIPYEPGRAAFMSLTRTMEDLASLADGRIEELPPRFEEVATPALAYLERHLFTERSSEGAPAIEGALRFFEGAGTRGVLELVGEELLSAHPRRARPGADRDRLPLARPVAGAAGDGARHAWRPVRTRVLRPPRQDGVRPGHAQPASLRLARRQPGRSLRVPALALLCALAAERRLPRGASAWTRRPRPDKVEEETIRLRDGQPLPVLEALRSAPSPLDAVAGLAASMLRAAYGLEAPPVSDVSRHDIRTHESVMRLLGELRGWSQLEGELSPEEIVAALERAEVRRASPAEPGRVAVLDLLRARTRRFEIVFVLGLEEGRLPRRGHESPFLADDVRRELDERSRARLSRPDQVARDRYLFYTACTRATQRVYLAREAAGDDGSPREPSPFWGEVVALFPRDDVALWTRRRLLSQLTWPLETAPTERERLRALALRAADERSVAEAIASANDWSRRLARALHAFERPTRLTHPQVLAELKAKTTFGVTELERFVDCSSMWFLDRMIDPKTMDREVDAKLRGSIAHQVLYRFYSGLPKELGVDRVGADEVDGALPFLRRCLDEAVDGVRMDLTELQRRELRHGLWRDLEAFAREDAAAESPLVPRRFEVLFGSERAAPELQRGLELADGLTVSGKIDRIDVDPFSARGIVQDYKAGKRGHSAAQIEQEQKLQIPLYMLVLRDLVGIEPLGGLYRPLAGERKARGLLRANAQDDGVPGFAKQDYRDEEAFWSQVERSRDLAVEIVDRMRSGDVKHDPKGGDCPTWCQLWPMCRVRRA